MNAAEIVQRSGWGSFGGMAGKRTPVRRERRGLMTVWAAVISAAGMEVRTQKCGDRGVAHWDAVASCFAGEHR